MGRNQGGSLMERYFCTVQINGKKIKNIFISIHPVIWLQKKTKGTNGNSYVILFYQEIDIMGSVPGILELNFTNKLSGDKI